jgi:MFS family permease
MIIPIGKMMDVYGGKKIILLFNIFVIIALIAIMYGNFYLFLIVMPLLGIASSSSSAAFQKLTADFTKRNIRGKTVGVMRFISLIVSAVGSLLGGYIYENTAHTTIFLLSMMISLVGVILFFFLVREPEVEEI